MKSGTAVFIVLLILIIIGLGGLTIYLLKNQNKPSSQKSDNIGDLLFDNPDSSWQDYSSPLGYLIKYPAKYFTVKNENSTTDTFNHELKDTSNVFNAGTIFVKRQETNIKDLDKIYTIIETSVEKTNSDNDLVPSALKNKKSLNLEDGTPVLEFDQTGIEEIHNLILLNGLYLYNFSYSVKNADTNLISYFNKMYPTVKFSNSGAKKDWRYQTTTLGLTLQIPNSWVFQEDADKVVTIVSPSEDILTLTNQKALALEDTGKKFLISANGKTVELTLPVALNNSPILNSVGAGQVQGTAIYLSLSFVSPKEEIRRADWETMQEIIKTLTVGN